MFSKKSLRPVAGALLSMPFLRLAGFALAAAAPAASFAHAATVPAAMVPAAAGQVAMTGLPLRRQGALFKVTRQNEVGYLFGTIHVGAKALYPLAPEISAALAASSELVLELDTRPNDRYQHALANHARYRHGEHIRTHVSPDTLVRLTDALHAVGIPLSSVSHLKPWLLANFLMGLELERSGYQRSDGNELFLLAQAQARGTAVAELESADEQLALFDTLSSVDSESYLRESLAQLGDGTSLRRAKATIDAWSSGDPVALDAVSADAVSGDSVMAQFTRRTLLGKRNPDMAARIAGMMEEGRKPFVGVGVLHLLGDESVPHLLSQRGYQVVRMY